MSGLTDFQVQVARIFFALPESAGFLVAGGAALIAQELVDRETRDLDLLEVGQHHMPAPMYQCGPKGQSDAGRAHGDDGDLLHGSHLPSDR